MIGGYVASAVVMSEPLLKALASRGASSRATALGSKLFKPLLGEVEPGGRLMRPDRGKILPNPGFLMRKLGDTAIDEPRPPPGP